jgi:hypothetical protein
MRVAPIRRMAMRFLSIYKSVETNTPPSAEHMAKMQKLVEDAMKAGWLLATEGCLPSAMGARVRRTGNKTAVASGPFTDAKEVTGGFAILEATSTEDAIDLTKSYRALAGDGECEIRQLYTPGDEITGCSTEATEELARA